MRGHMVKGAQRSVESASTWAALVWFAVAMGALGGWGCREEFPNNPIGLSLGEADVLNDGPLSMDESVVHTRLVGQDLVTEFSVSFSSGELVPIEGRCHITDVLTGDDVDMGEASFVLDARTATGTCRLDAARDWLSGKHIGTLVQSIEVTSLEGLYRLVSHKTIDSVAQTRVDFFGSDQLGEDGSGMIRAIAQDSKTGAPVSGVQIRVDVTQRGDRKTLAAGTTDDKGQVLLRYSVDHADEAAAMLQVAADLMWGEVLSPQVLLKPMPKGTHLVLTTDKPIYQPEQNIYIRVAAIRRSGGTPLSNAETVFSVFDSKGRKVARFPTTTNKFGVASAVMKLGRVIDLGTYRIEVDVGGTQTEKSITLSRYALPRFNVGIRTDRPYYLPNQTMTGSIDASYFFGRKVANASVSLKAYTYEAGFNLFADDTLFLDEQGRASFSLQLPDQFFGTEFLQGNAFVLLRAEVTDTAGHKEEASKSLVVAPADVLVFVVPDNSRLAPGMTNRFFVQTVSPAGSPLPCTVSLKADGRTLATANTDENGIDQVSFEVDSARLTITADAECQGGVMGEQSVSVGGEEAQDQAGLLVLADQPTARVGDQVDVTILAPPGDKVVYLDVVRAGLPILSVPVTLDEGEGTYQLQVSPDMVGLCELRAYTVSRSGVLVRNTRLLYVQSESSLDIALVPDRETYRPGDMAHLDITVTDAAGRGVSAAVGLAVVDEAVFALTDLQPGLEKEFFDFEEQLKEPSYQVKGCSFQDVAQATDDPARKEKAQLYLAAFNDPAAFYGVQWSLDSLSSKDSRRDQGQVLSRDAYKIAHALDRRVDSVADIEEGVAGMKLFDPWGRPYRVDASDRHICLESDGADETAGTNDDFSHICAHVIYRSDSRPTGADGAIPAWDAAVPVDGGILDDSGSPSGDGGSSPRLRKDFPETLYFRPSVITDDNGQAGLDIPLADSITTWRVSAIANGVTGGLGMAQSGITVFQPFFLEPDLPAYLLDSVDITIPVQVYNYSADVQDVTVTMQQDSWFTLEDGDSRTVTLEPHAVASVEFPIRVLHVGWHRLHVEGRSADFSDAVEKRILVRPNGKEFSATCAGVLSPDHGASCGITYPAQRIDGADELLVKIYSHPSGHIVEGLDAMIREPYG